MKKMLVAYYSWSNGNTKRIAEKLSQVTGADIVQIETVQPYTGNYDEVVAQGQREVKKRFRPQIQPLHINIKDYDIVAVGTPTWWYTMAPAVLSFLTQQNFAGKVVIPFMTNGGWPGSVIKDIKENCKGAEFAHEMEVQFDSSGGERLETPESRIIEWIEAIREELK